jgi:hypothetical protein
MRIDSNRTHRETPPEIKKPVKQEPLNSQTSTSNGTASVRRQETILTASYRRQELNARFDQQNTPNPPTLTDTFDQIDNLPRPDRNDPAAIREYNRQRAEIAQTALDNPPPPPQRSDFASLPGRTADFEYRDALSSYNSSINTLEGYVADRDSTVPPPINDEEASQAATDLINEHGGIDDFSEGDGQNVGRELAELSKTNPEEAIAIGNQLFEQLAGRDRNDDVARGIAEELSVEELRDLGLQPGGREFLERAEASLLDREDTSVAGEESSAASKINEALTGFDPNSLNGDPEHDALVVDEQLQDLPPGMRDDYVDQLLDHPYGREAIKYAGAMSPEGNRLLGEALGDLYAKDPSGVREALREITDSPDASLYPVAYQSGLAYAISQSGNDALIRDFAQNEINRAKGDPDEVRGYLNAVTAYAGLSPQALQDVMETNPDFFKAVEEAGRLTGGPPSSAGFENPNIWEPGLGNLLEKASQIRGPNGEATPEAIRLWETSINNAGANFRTMEGLGAFFVEHAEQLLDKYTDPLDPNTPGSRVLADFFGNVVYSPIGDLLQYKGGKLVDAIMGDANGNGGVIGSAIDRYLADANSAVEGTQDNDRLNGQRIGFIWNALSMGFLQGVQNYKDKWNDDKAFRDFTFDMLGRGLGKIADKFGLPGEVVSTPLDAVQGIYDARAEEDREEQLELFAAAFSSLNNSMFSRLNIYDAEHANVDGLHGGFVDSYGWEAIQEMFQDIITE